VTKGPFVDELGLFKAALGIAEPWRVTEATFDPEAGRLDLALDFSRGARFACPEGDESACAVHDTETRTWRHLDFFGHQAHLHARVPRVVCPAHGVRQIHVPWARPGSGFTLLFEALLLQFAAHMPVAAIARMVAEHDTRIWRVLEHYVQDARAGRHPGLAHHSCQQRHPRGHQQPGPSGQAQSPRLPKQTEDDHHHLPHRRSAPATHHPHNLARSHMMRRGCTARSSR
jgi:hypothetical protein